MSGPPSPHRPRSPALSPPPARLSSSPPLSSSPSSLLSPWLETFKSSVLQVRKKLLRGISTFLSLGGRSEGSAKEQQTFKTLNRQVWVPGLAFSSYFILWGVQSLGLPTSLLLRERVSFFKRTLPNRVFF